MAKIVVYKYWPDSWTWGLESPVLYEAAIPDKQWKRQSTAIRHAEAFREELGATPESLPIVVEEE